MYRGVSAKNYSRGKGEQSQTRVHLKSLKKKILSNKEWLAFFHNIKNKQHLLNLFVTLLYADDSVQPSPLSALANNVNEIFKTLGSVTKVFECSHEQNDVRVIFHALQQKTNVVVCSKDTDVFVSMVFAYAFNKVNMKTLCVVTIAMICSNSASL